MASRLTRALENVARLLERRLPRALRRRPRAAERPEPARRAAAEPQPPRTAHAAAPTLGVPEEQVRAAKLDLGPRVRAEEREERPAHIPWSYGGDRVTGAAVDPETLYMYWEVTDEAIERARSGLGSGGAGAWLALRVYDTSGLIFDGTNAHSYFDHGVDRSTRQWFFNIGKPTSTAFVDIGMKSSEGFFVKIARSGRVDFPRREPAAWIEPEWMTVRERGAVTGVVRGRAPAHRAAVVGAPAPGAAEHVPPRVMWVPSEREISGVRHLIDGAWERVEWRELFGESWSALEGRFEWEGPRVLSSWEAGPFTYPVQVAAARREEWEGRSFAYHIGDVTHVVYGPWKVVIRNLGARRERTVRARWEVFRSWVTRGGRELRVTAGVARPGASEILGASERLWLGGSELRAAGASELWRIGASEIMLRGASEQLFVGASQLMFRGASERRLVGASERLFVGASERRLGRASERRLLGASERRLASEARLGGASDRPYARASAQRPEGSSAARPPPDEGGYPELPE